MSSIRVWVHCPRCRTTYPSGYQICPRDSEALVSTSVDPLLGMVLDHRYRVEETIGNGLLGRVYRARNIRIARPCAIKVAAERSLVQGQATQRLLNEAEAGGRLDHPNVVAVIDRGELGDGGHPYLVMELADGTTLREHLARSNGLPIDAALAIAYQLALGLEHAHARGLVHRDLNPDNVMIGARGRVRILDFGLALIVDGDQPRLTGPGLVIGSPSYMAPEQAAGDPIDPRADLYGLGVVLFEMVSGRLPFEGTGTELACKAMYWTPPRLGERVEGLAVDPGIDELLQRLLANRPERRLGTATLAAAELADLIAQRAVVSPLLTPTSNPCLPAIPEPRPSEWADVPTTRMTAFRVRASSPDEAI